MVVEYALRPIGVVRSGLVDRKGAPRQGYEGAPDASIEIHPEFQTGIDGVRLDVRPLEAIDGTPVVDIKPVLEQSNDSQVFA